MSLNAKLSDFRKLFEPEPDPPPPLTAAAKEEIRGLLAEHRAVRDALYERIQGLPGRANAAAKEKAPPRELFRGEIDAVERLHNNYTMVMCKIVDWFFRHGRDRVVRSGGWVHTLEDRNLVSLNFAEADDVGEGGDHGG
jgi:hypothetical protein